MKNRFTIGEFSRLAIIPAKTLRYYDEIGLFKPVEVDSGTGYRYYSLEQLEPLDMIKYLRFLGVSLAEIQEHFRRRQIHGFLQLLKNQEAETEREIRRLRAKQKCFQKRVSEIEEALSLDKVGIPFIKSFSARRIFRVEGTIQTRSEIEFSLRKLAKLVPKEADFYIGMGKVGFVFSYDDLVHRRFGHYSAIYVILDEDLKDSQYVHLLPEKECACIFYRGSFVESGKYYPPLLDYIERNGYEIIGDSHERIRIDPFMTNEARHILRELRVPVRKRKREEA